MTIAEFKKNAILNISDFSPTASLDIEVFLEFILGFSKTQLLLNKDKLLDDSDLQWLNDAVEKRKSGLPVAYITGHKEFFGYDFFVSPSVLIPKPDTEILVERAVDLILQKMELEQNRLLTICDMCTGSGCIGLSVLRTLIDVYKIPFEKLPKFILADISEKALEIARKNGENLIGKTYKESEIISLRYIRSNLFEMVAGSFDFILTNPPYIPARMVEELLKDGRSEPRLALNGDINTEDGSEGWHTDGLDIVRSLIPQAKEHLAPMGTILMETGEYNAEAAAKIAQSYGLKTEIHKDLEGQLRVVEITEIKSLHTL